MAEAPNIVAYLKPVCGWSNSVRETFSKYGLQYEDKDIINNPEIYAEMVQKSGQPLSTSTNLVLEPTTENRWLQEERRGPFQCCPLPLPQEHSTPQA